MAKVRQARCARHLCYRSESFRDWWGFSFRLERRERQLAAAARSAQIRLVRAQTCAARSDRRAPPPTPRRPKWCPHPPILAPSALRVVDLPQTRARSRAKPRDLRASGGGELIRLVALWRGGRCSRPEGRSLRGSRRQAAPEGRALECQARGRSSRSGSSSLSSVPTEPVSRSVAAFQLRYDVVWLVLASWQNDDYVEFLPRLGRVEITHPVIVVSLRYDELITIRLDDHPLQNFFQRSSTQTAGNSCVPIRLRSETARTSATHSNCPRG
jgi:hypothetical protein